MITIILLQLPNSFLLSALVTLIVLCTVALGYVDTSALYHLIKGQSVIKLYVFFNMMEVRGVDFDNGWNFDCFVVPVAAHGLILYQKLHND